MSDDVASSKKGETKRLPNAPGTAAPQYERVVHRANAQVPHHAPPPPAPRPQPKGPTATSAYAKAPQDVTGDRWIGKTINNLRLLRCIGKGGFGAVYQAKHTQLETFFAVKIVNLLRAGSEEFAERFLREARVIAQLNHPNIVSVSDFGFIEAAECAYMVMDYLEGESLEAKMLREPEFSNEEISSLVEVVCDALTYIHQRGLIHRDLKPSNIFLARNPEAEGYIVKVLDFGIVAQEGESNLTTSGIWLGSPRYMSPEQATGEAHHADARADLYALGVILYELLTRQRMFQGTSVTMIHHHAFTPAPSLRDRCPYHRWDPSLEAWFQSVLSKQPNHRPASADAFWQTLAPMLASHPLPSKQSTLPLGHQVPLPQESQSEQIDTKTVQEEIPVAMLGWEPDADETPVTDNQGSKWLFLIGIPLLSCILAGWWIINSENIPKQPNAQSKRTGSPGPTQPTKRTKAEPRPRRAITPKKASPRQPPQKRTIRRNIVRRRRALPRRRQRKRIIKRPRRRRRTRIVAITIRSNPPTATVWKGSTRLGTTPIRIRGKRGQRLRLTIKKSGYIKKTQWITLRNAASALTLTLERDPFKGVKLKLP